MQVRINKVFISYEDSNKNVKIFDECQVDKQHSKTTLSYIDSEIFQIHIYDNMYRVYCQNILEFEFNLETFELQCCGTKYQKSEITYCCLKDCELQVLSKFTDFFIKIIDRNLYLMLNDDFFKTDYFLGMVSSKDNPF